MVSPVNVTGGTLTGGEGRIVIIEEFLTIEGHETLQDAVADTSGADGADDLVLEIKRVARDIGDLPVTTFNHLQMHPPFPLGADLGTEMRHALREQEQSS
jgi:hypothetical protein